MDTQPALRTCNTGALERLTTSIVALNTSETASGSLMALSTILSRCAKQQEMGRCPSRSKCSNHSSGMLNDSNCGLKSDWTFAYSIPANSETNGFSARV